MFRSPCLTKMESLESPKTAYISVLPFDILWRLPVLSSTYETHNTNKRCSLLDFECPHRGWDWWTSSSSAPRLSVVGVVFLWRIPGLSTLEMCRNGTYLILFSIFYNPFHCIMMLLMLRCYRKGGRVQIHAAHWEHVHLNLPLHLCKIRWFHYSYSCKDLDKWCGCTMITHLAI